MPEDKKGDRHMAEPQVTDTEIFDILWSSLKGGNYDLDAMKRTMNRDTNLGDTLDSLDVIDFVLRLEHHYKVRIPQADYPGLSSIAAIEGYVRTKSPLGEEAEEAVPTAWRRR
jgi:acyl carrier protein